MTKFAWLFVCMTTVTGIYGLVADSQDVQLTSLIASGVCASFLLLSLVMGRRIKFDPVLR
ncbi:hypothetical protein IFR35_26180 [Pseudomonas fluorescens]|jgi:4-amino-4-deoxy-L-arabinose transferase-like glycosyltransferase|uniref:PA3371 family protein n=1 Tax=Pseudomonas fluorescens TaxID=294 RepID=UPI00177EF72C|nr:PA3371 family protein [Pseudomonas fluorescens]MBD8194980.1 hypothetical protein [Pseudomonas fluorescens]MBD8229876.1 hypothetical protein [Pseudomonas fluorescens]MBD8787694.1 hypothetical protein [Pseudomonas fluorescens]MBD8820125.1 hypothetical protein [Pseudomonas fluorescens]